MNIRLAELRWYRKYGKYAKERIIKDSQGKNYVIGDYSWNRKDVNKNRQEFVEPEMSFIL